MSQNAAQILIWKKNVLLNEQIFVTLLQLERDIWKGKVTKLTYVSSIQLGYCRNKKTIFWLLTIMQFYQSASFQSHHGNAFISIASFHISQALLFKWVEWGNSKVCGNLEPFSFFHIHSVGSFMGQLNTQTVAGPLPKSISSTWHVRPHRQQVLASENSMFLKPSPQGTGGCACR